MGIDDYRFTTRWLVPATPREVADVLENPTDLPRWWPSVYLSTSELAPPDAAGVGRVVALHTRGWLPYTLRWTLTITDSFGPRGFAFDASGDFVGRGEWTFSPAGALTDATFDWRIAVKKPLLRALAPFLRPALEANHRWAMRRGEESLKLELERRRAGSEWERERVAAPPGPAVSSGWILLAGAAAALALGAAGGRAASRRRRSRRPGFFRRRA
jgi:hypothetical protein